MADFFFPHTVSVQAQTQTATSRVLGTPTLGSSQSADVCFIAKPKEALFDAEGVEVAHPAKLYCKAADASKFPIGAMVTYDSKVYGVMSAAIPHKDELSEFANSYEVLLSRV